MSKTEMSGGHLPCCVSAACCETLRWFPTILAAEVIALVALASAVMSIACESDPAWDMMSRTLRFASLRSS
jgi:hypothetical protein